MNPDCLSPSPGQQGLSAEPSTSTGVRHYVPPVVASSDESENAQIEADRARAMAMVHEAERAESSDPNNNKSDQSDSSIEAAYQEEMAILRAEEKHKAAINLVSEF